jgi:Activator of Hsp90 ATPase homolog 1-like protein
MNDLTDAGVEAPVRKQLTVRLAQQEAFELFTAGLSRWWPLATHSCSQANALRVVIEPRAGGSVLEYARDGSTATWGTVLVWDPPRRFAMSWRPGSVPEQATRVDVSFSDAGQGMCRVELVHSGWEARGAEADTVRSRYDGGWNVVFAAYEAAARGGFGGGR